MTETVCVVGVGMTPFRKPSAESTYLEMGSEAAKLALTDSGLPYDAIQQAYVGWVYGDSASGQAALYTLGLSGIPIINVNNNCATGSTALYLARQAVASGAVDCALALGFEQMLPGPLEAMFDDRPTPFDRALAIADAAFGEDDVPMAVRLFGGAGYEYQERYGVGTQAFAEVRAKASRHAQHNDKAIFRTVVTAEQVLESPRIFLNVTRLQCCPPTSGGAAAILCSEAFARARGLDASVRIGAQCMTTDTASSFQKGNLIKAVGYDMTRQAARCVYESAGIGPDDLDVVELHDCFTMNEIISYEALGLCGEGEAERFVLDGDNTYGGRVVTNPSGGLLCKGHPLGATGLGQCCEIVTQLRGDAGVRQVPGARIGLQQNLGLGGACVVTLYQRT